MMACCLHNVPYVRSFILFVSIVLRAGRPFIRSGCSSGRSVPSVISNTPLSDTVPAEVPYARPFADPVTR